MEHELRMGLSVWAIAAIVCNSLVGVLILILFVILYKACKVPSRPEKAPGFTAEPEHKQPEQKYLLKQSPWQPSPRLFSAPCSTRPMQSGQHRSSDRLRSLDIIY